MHHNHRLVRKKLNRKSQKQWQDAPTRILGQAAETLEGAKGPGFEYARLDDETPPSAPWLGIVSDSSIAMGHFTPSTPLSSDCPAAVLKSVLTVRVRGVLQVEDLIWKGSVACRQTVVLGKAGLVFLDDSLEMRPTASGPLDLSFLPALSAAVHVDEKMLLTEQQGFWSKVEVPVKHSDFRVHPLAMEPLQKGGQTEGDSDGSLQVQGGHGSGGR